MTSRNNNSMHFPRHHHESGVSLVAALFMVVVLGGLGVFLAVISSTQHTTTVHAYNAAKAYQAARSGIEWGIYRAVNNQNCNGSLSLNEFTITITCQSRNVTEGEQAYQTVEIKSVAQTGSIGQANRAVRQIETVIDVMP